MATQKKPAKKSTKKKPAKKAKPVGVDELHARTLGAIAAQPEASWRNANGRQRAEELVPVVEHCLAAGRADLAEAIAKALPLQRGKIALRLQAQLGVDAVVDAALADVRDSDIGVAACHAAAFAIELSHTLEAQTPRTKELDEAARASIDRHVEQSYTYDLGLPLAAYVARGDHASADAMLERALADDNLEDSMAFALWRLGPARVIEHTGRGRADKVLKSEIANLEGWSYDQVVELADQAMGTWARPALGRMLVADGRIDEAKKLVLDDPAWDQLYPAWQAERLELVGDTKKAEAVRKAAPVPVDDFFEWAQRERHAGRRTFAELWALAAKRESDKSVMAPIQMVCFLVNAALDDGLPLTEVQPAVDAVEALFALSFRTPYDRGVEGSRINQFRMVQARCAMAAGDLAGAQATVEADFKNIKELLAYGKDAYAKSNLLVAFAARAVAVHRPDLAVKIAMKISKANRPKHAARVAAGFLPDVGGALAAVDKLAKPEEEKILMSGGLLGDMWAVVLAAPT
jgi:hypothetical protein